MYEHIPRIREERLPNHDPVRPSLLRIAHHVRRLPHVAVTHHWDLHGVLERPDLCEVRRARPPPARRDVARVQREPRCACGLEARAEEGCRGGVLAESELDGDRDREGVREGGDCR